MLNKDALQQLTQLKTNIVAQKQIAQGLVRTTQKRFGFVMLDDGREAFLDPDQMLRVLPDDRVEVEIITNSKDQLEARLEKLIHSPLKEFVGRYVNKNNNFFVEPDIYNFNRWLFVPPQDRKGFEVNDLVHCIIARHPFSDGKAQVRVINRLGQLDDAGIENRYTVAKYNLPNEFTPAAQTQASSINWLPLTYDNGEEDLTHLPFVTIDSENTRDMDDAIYITANENGWDLIVAIADPSRHIEINTALEVAARGRASTAYLLGQSLTMLPPELSHDTYSLVAEKKRPALVCKIKLTIFGEVLHYTFVEAQIRSQHKLSYNVVSDHLLAIKDINSVGFSVSDEIKSMLITLKTFAEVRATYRLNNCLVMDDRADYAFILNEQKKIDRVEKRERNIAQRIIEEAMLVTNICAGDLFIQHPGYGIFSTHIGFRPERLNDAISLITEDRPDLIADGLTAKDLTQLEHFQKLFKELRLNPSANPKSVPLLSLLQRMLQAGALSFDPIPHFGLGFKAYAMVTSPIRRYHDFYNHLAIKNILRAQPNQSLTDETKKTIPSANLAIQLQEQINYGRQACRYLETWLCCQFMAQQVNTLHAATVTLVNGNGVGVLLESFGIEAYALLAPKNSELKSHFDSRRLSLTIEDKTYRLDEKIHVLIKEVDVEKRKIALEVVNQETAERLSAWL